MSTQEVQLKKAAKVLLERANLKRGENLVVTADTVTDVRIVDAIFATAREVGAVALAVTVPSVAQGDHYAESPQLFVDALKSADLVLPLIRFSSYAESYLDVLKQKRVLGFAVPPSVSQFINWILKLDYKKMDKLCQVVTDLLYKTREFKITSKVGTDITMMLGDRHVADDPGKVEKAGDENYLPGACVCPTPLEDTWNGTIVYDALLYPPIGLLKSLVRLEVSNGVIKSIEGGKDAEKFNDWLASFSDPNMYRMAHLGIGTNHHFKRFTGIKSLDERMYGIVGAGIGTNDIPVFQGNIRAKGHTDGYMKSASVYLDGELLIKDGRFVHPKIAG